VPSPSSPSRSINTGALTPSNLKKHDHILSANPNEDRPKIIDRNINCGINEANPDSFSLTENEAMILTAAKAILQSKCSSEGNTDHHIGCGIASQHSVESSSRLEAYIEQRLKNQEDMILNLTKLISQNMKAPDR